MKSIRDVYKIGKGPSSSHTMGPERAARLFLSKYPDAETYRVVLYGSLSKTGRGHGTDRVLYISLCEYVELNEGPGIWDFLAVVWQSMKQAVADGLAAEGTLPGGLNVERKA